LKLLHRWWHLKWLRFEILLILNWYLLLLSRGLRLERLLELLWELLLVWHLLVERQRLLNLLGENLQWLLLGYLGWLLLA
jgi:hypothetical protein